MIKIKLRQILWDKEITAVSVHKATGISQTILSNIIRGKRTNVGLESFSSEKNISFLTEFLLLRRSLLCRNLLRPEQLVLEDEESCQRELFRPLQFL